jgi:hypothetical protein
MPAPGEKDAQGYVWNGIGWVDPKTGFLKASKDEQRSKQGLVGQAWDLTKDVGSALTKAETWANPAGQNATGLLRVAGGLNSLINPISNVGAAKVDINEGNWKGALLNTGLAAAGIFGGAQGLGGALTLGGRAVRAGSKGAKTFQNLGTALEGTTGLRRAGTFWKGINPTKAGKAISLAGAGSLGLGLGGMLNNKPTPPTASSVLPGRDGFNPPPLITDSNRNRVIPGTTPPAAPGTGGAGAPGTGGAGAGAGKLGLLGLDPDQLAQTGESMTALEKMYQDALNQYDLQEQQGQQGYTQAVQGARRRAVGTEQDLATQLTAAGLDFSPVAAFGVGQMANAPRQAQETAARKSLDQLLAELTMGRTQAKTKRDTDKLMINRLINDYRIKNTLAAQQGGYEAMGGF